MEMKAIIPAARDVILSYIYHYDTSPVNRNFSIFTHNGKFQLNFEILIANYCMD